MSDVNRNESVLTCHVPLHTLLLNFQQTDPTSFFLKAYPVSPPAAIDFKKKALLLILLENVRWQHKLAVG